MDSSPCRQCTTPIFPGISQPLPSFVLTESNGSSTLSSIKEEGSCKRYFSRLWDKTLNLFYSVLDLLRALFCGGEEQELSGDISLFELRLQRLRAILENDASSSLDELLAFWEAIQVQVHCPDRLAEIKRQLFDLFELMPEDVKCYTSTQVAYIQMAEGKEEDVGRYLSPQQYGLAEIKRDPLSWYVKKGVTEVLQILRLDNDVRIISTRSSSNKERVAAFRDLFEVKTITPSHQGHSELDSLKIDREIRSGYERLPERVKGEINAISPPESITNPLEKMVYRLDKWLANAN